MIKSTRWYCKTEDARELKRIALELGDLNQEEAFGRAVAALRGNMEAIKPKSQSRMAKNQETA
jgi:hypothetical protein